MTKASAAHTTPVTTRELYEYLVRRGAVITKSTGSSHIRVTFADGQTATIVATQGAVSAVILRTVAEKLGLTYRQLRAELGAPVQAKGKPRGKTQAPPERPATKGDVRRLLEALRSEIAAIERDATARDRDPSVYARAQQCALAALKHLSRYQATDAIIRTEHGGT